MQPQPEHETKALVPDGCRHNRLPADVRQWLDIEVAERLAGMYQWTYNQDEERGGYEDFRHSALTRKEWRWYGKGSERTVACLGRTFRGDPMYEHLHGVVVKFNPWLRPAVDATPTVTTVNESGNLHELALWSHVRDRGEDLLFGTILDYSEHGDWLAMKQYIPVYRYSDPVFANRSIDYVRENWSERMAGTCDRLYAALRDRGYDAHTKDGNVGITVSADTASLIDYGAHVDVDDADGSTGEYLTEYVLGR